MRPISFSRSRFVPSLSSEAKVSAPKRSAGLLHRLVKKVTPPLSDLAWQETKPEEPCAQLQEGTGLRRNQRKKKRTSLKCSGGLSVQLCTKQAVCLTPEDKKPPELKGWGLEGHIIHFPTYTFSKNPRSPSKQQPHLSSRFGCNITHTPAPI